MIGKEKMLLVGAAVGTTILCFVEPHLGLLAVMGILIYLIVP